MCESLIWVKVGACIRQELARLPLGYGTRATTVFSSVLFDRRFSHFHSANPFVEPPGHGTVGA